MGRHGRPSPHLTLPPMTPVLPTQTHPAEPAHPLTNRYSMRWPVVIILWVFVLVFRLASILALKVSGRPCASSGLSCLARLPCPHYQCVGGPRPWCGGRHGLLRACCSTTQNLAPSRSTPPCRRCSTSSTAECKGRQQPGPPPSRPAWILWAPLAAPAPDCYRSPAIGQGRAAPLMPAAGRPLFCLLFSMAATATASAPSSPTPSPFHCAASAALLFPTLPFATASLPATFACSSAAFCKATSRSCS